MRQPRRLALKSEALAELTTSEMTGVAAGAQHTPLCPVVLYTDRCTHPLSFDQPTTCATLPLKECLSVTCR